MTSAHYQGASNGPTIADAAVWAERAFVVIALLLFSNALLPQVLASPENPESSAVLRLMWLPVYALTLVAISVRPASFLRASALSALLLIPVGMAFASFLWAVDPDLALRRGVALVMTTAFGLYLAVRFGWREFLQLVGVAYAVLVIGNLLAVLLVPSFGVHHEIHPGAWKGLWFEKNTLGAEMARAFLVFMCVSMFSPERRRMWIGFAVAAAVLVLASTSKTALLALMLAAAVLVGVRTMRTGPALALLFGYAALLVGFALTAFVVLAPDMFFELLGKDPTLTGRTDIWTVLIGLIQERPWLGYGYQTFWDDPLGPAFWVREATQWDVPTAHNGWLETMLSIGVIGAGAFAVALLAVFVLSLSRLGRGRDGYWAIGWVVLFILFSISESSILGRNSLAWVLFIATSAKLFVGERDAGPSADYGASERRFSAARP